MDRPWTLDPYAAGLRKKVLPALGHLPLSMMTAGLVDQTIDQWEADYDRSTVKNTIAALVLVLDEAVRDGLLVRNPAKDRARRCIVGRSPIANAAPERPRDFALPDVRALTQLVDGAWARFGRHSWLTAGDNHVERSEIEDAINPLSRTEFRQSSSITALLSTFTDATASTARTRQPRVRQPASNA